MNDILLKIFEVKSHRELIEFIKKNPNDKHSIEIKETLELFGIKTNNLENKIKDSKKV